MPHCTLFSQTVRAKVNKRFSSSVHSSGELMAKHGTRRIERFISVHWPAGVLLGLSAYVGARYGLGAQSSVHIVIAWMSLSACWFAAFVYCLGYRRRMRRLVVRDELNELRGIHWRDFETQVAQAFRFRGYAVEHAGQAD